MSYHFIIFCCSGLSIKDFRTFCPFSTPALPLSTHVRFLLNYRLPLFVPTPSWKTSKELQKQQVLKKDMRTVLISCLLLYSLIFSQRDDDKITCIWPLLSYRDHTEKDVLLQLRPRLHGNGSMWNRTRTVRIGLVLTRELMEPFHTEPLAVPELVPHGTEPKSSRVNSENRSRQVRLETRQGEIRLRIANFQQTKANIPRLKGNLLALETETNDLLRENDFSARQLPTIKEALQIKIDENNRLKHALEQKKKECLAAKQ